MHLTTRPFALERHMIAPLAESLPGLLCVSADQSMRMLREPSIGLVIPDLLVGTWRPAHLPRTYASITRLEAHVFAVIERVGTISRRALRDTLHLSVGALATAELRLARNGIIRCIEGTTGDPTWTLVAEARTDQIDITAIEAKLSRWSDAVDQAAAYLRFADRAYVVLDGNRLDAHDAMRAAVRAAGIGLVFQYERVLAEVIPAPRHPAEPSHARVQATAKLLTPRGGRAIRGQHGRSARIVRTPATEVFASV